MILFTPLSCDAFGLAENLAAKCVAYEMSGLDEPENNLVGRLLIDTANLKFGLLPPNLYSKVDLPLVCLLEIESLSPANSMAL